MECWLTQQPEEEEVTKPAAGSVLDRYIKPSTTVVQLYMCSMLVKTQRAGPQSHHKLWKLCSDGGLCSGSRKTGT